MTTLLLCATSCYYHRKNETYSSAATVTPHFSSINAGIIQPKCLPCHDASNKGKDLSNYAGVFAHATPFSAASSMIYTQVESGAMPIDRPIGFLWQFQNVNAFHADTLDYATLLVHYYLLVNSLRNLISCCAVLEKSVYPKFFRLGGKVLSARRHRI
jgi:hypothetical protein